MKSQKEIPLLFSIMTGLYSSMICSCRNNEQYRCSPTFNHNVGCKGRVTLSVFLLNALNTEDAAYQCNVETYFIYCERLTHLNWTKRTYAHSRVISNTPAKF